MIIRLLALILLVTACGGADSPTTGPAPAPSGVLLALSWTQPALNVDGTALTDIASYRVEYGTSPSTLTQTVVVPGTQLNASVRVAPGTYYATVRTVNSIGEMSAPSAVVTAVLQ